MKRASESCVSASRERQDLDGHVAWRVVQVAQLPGQHLQTADFLMEHSLTYNGPEFEVTRLHALPAGRAQVEPSTNLLLRNVRPTIDECADVGTGLQEAGNEVDGPGVDTFGIGLKFQMLS